MDSMWWPAVAQTNSPPASDSMAEIACAFSRRSASPVRITAPVSMSSLARPAPLVGLDHDVAQLVLVDAGQARIGRQRDGGEIELVAGDDVIAAGEVFGEAAQVDAREDDLRAGGADVDAHARQVDVVLDPERVFLDRPVVLELVVLVVRVGVMLMVEGLAGDVFAEGVGADGLDRVLDLAARLLVLVRHRSPCAQGSSAPPTLGARPAVLSLWAFRRANGPCCQPRGGPALARLRTAAPASRRRNRERGPWCRRNGAPARLAQDWQGVREWVAPSTPTSSLSRRRRGVENHLGGPDRGMGGRSHAPAADRARPQGWTPRSSSTRPRRRR